MNVKIAAVLLLCAFIAAEARPGKGKRSHKGHKEKKPHHPPEKADDKGGDSKPDHHVNKTVEGLKELCEGLSSGNITNTNSSYDAVFTSLGDVCADVAAYLAAQAAPPQAPVQDSAAGTVRRKRGARSARQKGHHGGSHHGNHNGHSEENDGEENTAVDMLFRICKRLERVQINLPADLASDLANIITKTGTVCAAADLVRNPA